MILNERTPGPRARPDQFASIDQAQEMGAPIDKQGLRQKRVLLIRESEEGEDVVPLLAQRVGVTGAKPHAKFARRPRWRQGEALRNSAAAMTESFQGLMKPKVQQTKSKEDCEFYVFLYVYKLCKKTFRTLLCGWTRQGSLNFLANIDALDIPNVP